MKKNFVAPELEVVEVAFEAITDENDTEGAGSMNWD